MENDGKYQRREKKGGLLECEEGHHKTFLIWEPITEGRRVGPRVSATDERIAVKRRCQK